MNKIIKIIFGLILTIITIHSLIYGSDANGDTHQAILPVVIGVGAGAAALYYFLSGPGSEATAGGNSKWSGGLTYGLRNWDNIITPYWINFRCVEYSNKQGIRDNASDEIDAYADINLPMPRTMTANNGIQYTLGQSETKGGLTDPTTAGFFESVSTGFGFTTWFKDVTGASDWAGQRMMDERDSIFKGANFRQHTYEWTLINKFDGDGQNIAEICNAFQSLAYPFLSDDQYYSRVIHPGVWYIEQFSMTREGGTDEDGNQELQWKKNQRSTEVDTTTSPWDYWPLPCVLTNVSIQTAGAAAGGVYAGPDGLPAATKLSLTFQELEPAINTGTRIHSRSQARGGEY